MCFLRISLELVGVSMEMSMTSDSVNCPLMHSPNSTQVTGSYELLNYSEFGTEVNGQLFSCDLTEHAATPAAPFKKPAAIRTPSDDPKSFYANIRQIVDKRRGIRRQELDEVDAGRQR